MVCEAPCLCPHDVVNMVVRSDVLVVGMLIHKLRKPNCTLVHCNYDVIMKLNVPASNQPECAASMQST